MENNPSRDPLPQETPAAEPQERQLLGELAVALADFYAMVRGESPSLLEDDINAIRAEQALTKVQQYFQQEPTSAARPRDSEINCPACSETVKQVSSATLSLALWQHWNWICPKRDSGEPKTATFEGLLTDVAQLLDGWHQDGTAWTEWDESVRRLVSDALRAVSSCGCKAANQTSRSLCGDGRCLCRCHGAAASLSADTDRRAGLCCILNADSPSYPPEPEEYWQCRCRACVKHIVASAGDSGRLREQIEALPRYRIDGYMHHSDAGQMPASIEKRHRFGQWLKRKDVLALFATPGAASGEEKQPLKLRTASESLGAIESIGPQIPRLEPSDTMCGRCYDECVEVFPANCNEKPEALAGQPLGMYHCPDCGAMVVAGVPHPDLCRVCIDRKHPGFDEPPAMEAEKP